MMGTYSSYRVGSFLKDLDAQNLKNEENLPPLGKDDFKIILKDVTTLRFHEVYSDNNPYDMEISIYTWEKRYFLSAILAEGGTRLEQFLREKIPANVQLDRKTISHYIPSLNRKRRDIMRMIYIGVCAFATIVGLSWMFLDVPYRLFALVGIAPCTFAAFDALPFPQRSNISGREEIRSWSCDDFLSAVTVPLSLDASCLPRL